MASSKGAANYKTVAEFEDAMRLAYRKARQDSPDDPSLKGIGEKWAEADAARKSYHAVVAAGGESPSADQQAAVAGLKKNALRTEEEAETALKKWYSNHWRGR